MKKLFLGLIITVFIILVLCISNQLFAQTNAMLDAVMQSTVAIVSPVGLGAGIVVNEEGYIVTNAHVVRGAKYLDVYTSDWTIYAGRIVGIHSEGDIAVIKILTLNDKPVVPVRFDELELEDKLYSEDIANYRQTFIGDRVYAIGHPIGLAWTVTSGIITAKREGPAGIKYIQTDASINQGNSGGPMLNENGRVVGINTLGVPPHYAENVAVAIAIQSFMEEIAMLIEADMERQEVITDIWAYLEGEEPEEKPEPRQIIIQLGDGDVVESDKE